MQYDAGIAFGEEFKGTKIPTLDELLEAAEGRNVIIALDKKIKTDNMKPLFDTVARHNVRVTFSCADMKRIKTVLERFPDAYIDYDGEATDEKLEEVCSVVKPENLMVWMYLDKPNFIWLESTRKCSPEKCERTKRHARLGVANVCNPYDLKEAMEFEPDCVEM
jgi:glycerophosphoryl diester phosphodiesterase